MRNRLVIISSFIASLVAVVMLTGATLDAQRGRGGPGGRPAAGPPPAAQSADAPAPGGPAAQAPQGRMGRAGGPRGAGGPFFAPGVNLTEDQRTRVEAIVRSARDERAPIADELQLVRRQLQREIFADAPNASRVSDLAARVAALEKQLLDSHVKTQTALAAVLTPEQRQSVRAAGGGPGGPGGPRGRRAGR